MPDTATPPADARARLWELVEQCEAQAGPELTVPADGARRLATDLRDLLARATTPGDRDRGRGLAEARNHVLGVLTIMRVARLSVDEQSRAILDLEAVARMLHRALAAPAETRAGSEVGNVPPLWWSPTRGVIQADEDAYSTVRSAGWTLVAHLPDDAVRLAATPPAPEGEAVTTAEVIAWHRARFGGDPADVLVMGKLAEEAGEVCGAITKRAEGAVRPAKGLVTREDWSAHLLDEVGDVGIVLHTLCAREGTTLDEVVTRRFREDVSKRVGQEAPPQQATGDQAEPRTDWSVPTLAPDLRPASEKEAGRG